MNPGIALAVYAYRHSPQKSIIDEDIAHWKEILRWDEDTESMLRRLLTEKQEFRNLLYYRLGGIRIVSRLLRFLLPPLPTLYIWTPKIGGGLFIQHGFATVIAAKELGKHCFVNQQVTIGYKGENAPTIGNNVMVTCGSKILGGVNIGDNVVVGANSVVVKDVPADVTVVGIPAKILKHNNSQNNNIWNHC